MSIVLMYDFVNIWLFPNFLLLLILICFISKDDVEKNVGRAVAALDTTGRTTIKRNTPQKSSRSCNKQTAHRFDVEPPPLGRL